MSPRWAGRWCCDASRSASSIAASSIAARKAAITTTTSSPAPDRIALQAGATGAVKTVTVTAKLVSGRHLDAGANQEFTWRGIR
ncbi:MAG: hypothetical protein WA895_28035 [Streptosporangiaceae bacterium]